MHCEEFERIFYAELSKRGTAKELAALHRHAAGCARCSRLLSHRPAMAATLQEEPPRRRSLSLRAARTGLFLALSCAIIAGVRTLDRDRAQQAATAALVSAGQRIHRLLAPKPRDPWFEPSVPADTQAPPPPPADDAVASLLRARNEEDGDEEPVRDEGPPSFERAMRLYRMGRKREAADEFERASDRGVPDESSLWAARSMREAGDVRLAALLFDRVATAASRSPVGAEALLEAARCYRLLGSTDAARVRLRSLKAVPAYAPRAQAELDSIDAELQRMRDAIRKARSAPPPAAPLPAGPLAPAVEAMPPWLTHPVPYHGANPSTDSW